MSRSGGRWADETIHRIMSMTKPVTGVALMMLHEEGRWRLDDPVARHIPQFADLAVATADGGRAPLARPMLMRDLVTSTAGFSMIVPLHIPLTGLVRSVPVAELYRTLDLQGGSLSRMVERLASAPLAYQPGTDFEYGVTHDLQGHLIEVLSGQTLDDFFAERIFRPLGMADTGFELDAAQRARLSTVYAWGPDGLAPSPPSVTTTDGSRGSYPSAGGGLYSTLDDYLKFARMLADGGRAGGQRLLSPASVRLMTSSLLPAGVRQHFGQRLDGLGYGVGVGVVEDPARATAMDAGYGRGTYYWTGWLGSWWWNDPASDLTVIGVTQQEGAAMAHVGLPQPGADLRALSAALVYGALMQP
ncbi:serine hydrolase domain-containing protein [Caulobacter sp. KR2-114]|uniref:serine hydrolase domain-containing protein n=1 Tax=Caulobacter sp. KR2-114 TaxID=3400912 RepID=UPI003C0EC9C2